MSFRSQAIPLVALTLAALYGCHASTEITPDRLISVCVDAQSDSGLGDVLPAHDAKVFAIVSGTAVEFAFTEIDAGCAYFTRLIRRADSVSSITAFDPSAGGTTLLEADADELHLRIHDATDPFRGATTVKLSGSVAGLEDGDLVLVSGDGLSNRWEYGNSHNELRIEENGGFEFDLGTWTEAPETEIFFTLREEGATFHDLSKLFSISIDRDADVELPPIDFSEIAYPSGEVRQRRARLTDGFFTCHEMGLRSQLTHTTTENEIPMLMGGDAECINETVIAAEAFVFQPARWIALNFMGTVGPISSGLGGVVYFDSENDADYLIPNIASYDLDISAERGVSGSVSLSGANASTSVSLRSFIQTGERELVWDIYTERNDLIEIDPDEYALIREAIGSAIDIESLDYHLQIRDGYDGKPWETASINAVSHHSFFSVKLNSSP